jgi:hypothetical protein
VEVGGRITFSDKQKIQHGANNAYLLINYQSALSTNEHGSETTRIQKVGRSQPRPGTPIPSLLGRMGVHHPPQSTPILNEAAQSIRLRITRSNSKLFVTAALCAVVWS